MIVDSTDSLGGEGSAGFKPRTRRIVLAPPSATKAFDLRALTVAARAIAAIEKDRERSSQAYFKAADSAFKTIKDLINHCQTEAMKPRLKKLLDAAYYHRKQAEALDGSKTPRNDASDRKVVRTLGEGVRKKKPKPRSPKAPTIMETRLAELGIKRSKK